MKINLHKILIRLCRDLNIDDRTCNYLTTRLNAEGYKFLTVTLPKLGKFLLRSIELGGIYYARKEDPSFTCFAWMRRSCVLKHFSGLLRTVFSSKGLLLKDVDVVAIYQLRFLANYFYKLAIPHDVADEPSMEEQFVDLDNNLSFDRRFAEELRKSFETHYRFILNISGSDVLSMHLPRHGPGSFSTGIRNPDVHFTQYKDITPDVPEWGFPFSFKGKGFFNPHSRVADYLHSPYSELLFVPKDSRGPRTIVREPFRNLFYQMSFFDFMVHQLQRITNGNIQFSDQERMKLLAKESSRDMNNATLDLSNASDSLSFSLCNIIYRNFLPYRYFTKRFRTSHVKLPSGKLHKLKKLSGMGSGFTFPVMALTIHHAISYAISQSSMFNGSYRDARKCVYVYGDDIIVPSRFYGLSKHTLQRIGFKLNESKSFTDSHFRESCGGDYYNGEDMTTVKLKLNSVISTIPSGTSIPLDSSGNVDVLQIVKHANELELHGFKALPDYYYDLAEKRLKHRLPYANPLTFPGLCRRGYQSPETDNVGHYKDMVAFVAVPSKRSRYYYLPNSDIARSLSIGFERLSSEFRDYFTDSTTLSLPRRIRLIRKRISQINLEW